MYTWLVVVGTAVFLSIPFVISFVMDRSGTAGTGTSVENPPYASSPVPPNMPRTGEEAICMPQKAVGHRADRNEAPAKVVFHRLGTFFRNIIFFYSVFF